MDMVELEAKLVEKLEEMLKQGNDR